MIHFLMRGQERRGEAGGDGARPHPCDGNYYRHVHNTLLCPSGRDLIWPRAADECEQPPDSLRSLIVCCMDGESPFLPRPAF